MAETEIGVAVALEALRGAVNTGFARLDGQLAVALQRTDVVERDINGVKEDISSLEEELKGQIGALDARMGPTEKKIWIASGFAAAFGAGGASLWQLLG